MFRLCDNYYHRNCYLEREQVPTQTVMMNTMTKSLANVYFKSMRPKLKVLAGLEPLMAGGGTEWYMPPEEILKGRAALKPVKLAHLRKMGYTGLITIGEESRDKHYAALIQTKRQAVIDSDTKWKEIILESNRQQYKAYAETKARENTEALKKVFQEFEVVYRTSINNIQSIIYDAAIAEIKKIREEAFQHMQYHFEQLLAHQATTLYDEYDNKLKETKASLKNDFIKQAESLRFDMLSMYHDINVEKRTILEKLRHMLECQNLACQVYVALKERDEGKNEIEISKRDHRKKVKVLEDEINIRKYEINREIGQHLKCFEFNFTWRKKICHVVKKFQIFVEYCLKLLPKHAEFFINMEKLMFLQLNEASENPIAESIIETSESLMTTPIPNPHPHYLFCDKGYKPHDIAQNLCPKSCTSSASHIPVIVINKKFIYTACDNLELFSGKVTQYLAGHRGDDVDFEDHHKYNLDVPIRVTPSVELKDLHLESSFMHIFEAEMADRKDLRIECSLCKLPYCFCTSARSSKVETKVSFHEKPELRSIKLIGNQLDKNAELRLQREPKWESYLDYVLPRKCKCAKIAKKHLEEHLPSYMSKMSPFEHPELPNYEPCSAANLKKLVKMAKGIHTPPPPPEKVEKTKDASTQYSDHEFDLLCTCLSDDATKKLFEKLQGSNSAKTDPRCIILDGSRTPSYLTKSASSFATQRAFSLRNLIDEAPVLQEIFNSINCDYNK